MDQVLSPDPVPVPEEARSQSEPDASTEPQAASLETTTGANVGDEGIIKGVEISENYEGDLAIKEDSEEEVSIFSWL
jgi:hypothetical protein